MSNGKKFLRVLGIFILFIPAYLAIYNIYIISSDKFTVENITKIEILAGVDGPVLVEYTDNDNIKMFIKTLENAGEIGATIRNLKNEQPLILKFHKGEKPYIYGLYLSLNANDCIVMETDGSLRHMNEKDAAILLKTELSDSFYSHNKLPVAVLFYGGESVPIYPSGGEWLLKKPGGVFLESTIENVMAQTNTARAYQNKPFDIRFPAPPDALFIEVTDGKEIIYSDIFGNFDANFSSGEMKDLQYVLSAEWWEKEETDFCGSAKYVLDVKYFVQAKFDISGAEASVGDIAAITAHNISEEEILTLETDMEYTPKFTSAGTNKIAFIPIGADAAGKTFNLILKSETNEPVSYFIKINDSGTPKSINMGAQDQYVDAHLEKGPQADRLAKYNDIFSVESIPGQKDWLEKFSMPIEGKLLLEYGWKITINTGYPRIYEGVLIDSNTGDPIKASNGGRVVFAGVVPYEGNLVVIDHGAGIKSWYGHLGTMDVKPGETVMKGQQIGTGGRTGMITGISSSYVYFAVSVENVFVNPVPVVENGITGVEALVSEKFDYGLPEAEKNADIPEPAEPTAEAVVVS